MQRTIGSCKRKARFLSEAHGVDLQINVEYGQPSVLARSPGGKRWRTVVTRRSTGEVFDALCHMEEAWELVDKNAPAIKPAFVIVEVSGGTAEVTHFSAHAVVTVIDHDTPMDAEGSPRTCTTAADLVMLELRHSGNRQVRTETASREALERTEE